MKSMSKPITLGALCFLVQLGNAAVVPPIVAQKKQVRVVRTECTVVATEAKRIVAGFNSSEPYARELYSRISENVNLVHIGGVPVHVLDLLSVPSGRDVLGAGVSVRAPSGPGWRPQYRDTLDQNATQRHHFGFYFFAAANDGGIDLMFALFGNGYATVSDIWSDNQGDLDLADEALRDGFMARDVGVQTVSGQVKSVLCQ